MAQNVTDLTRDDTQTAPKSSGNLDAASVGKIAKILHEAKKTIRPPLLISDLFADTSYTSCLAGASLQTHPMFHQMQIQQVGMPSTPL